MRNRIFILILLVILLFKIENVLAITSNNYFNIKVTNNGSISDRYSFTPKFIAGVTEIETNYDKLKYFNVADSDKVAILSYNDYRKNYNDENGSYLKSSNKFYIKYLNVGQYENKDVDMKITLTSIDFGILKIKDNNGNNITNNSIKMKFDTNDIGVYFRGVEDISAYGSFKIEYFEHDTSKILNIPSVISYTDIDVEVLGLENNKNIDDIYVYKLDNTGNSHLDVTMYQNEISNIFKKYEEERLKNGYNSAYYNVKASSKSFSTGFNGGFLYFFGNKNYTADCSNSSGDIAHRTDVNCGLYNEFGYIMNYYDSIGNKSVYNPLINPNGNLSDSQKKLINDMSNAGIVTVVYNSSPMNIRTYGWYTKFTDVGFLNIETKKPTKSILVTKDDGSVERVPKNYIEVDNDLFNKTFEYEIKQSIPNLSSDWYYLYFNIYDHIPSELSFNLSDVKIYDDTGKSKIVNDLFEINKKEEENELNIDAKKTTLSDPSFYNKTYTIVVKVQINNKVCNGCDSSDINKYVENIKNLSLKNQAFLIYDQKSVKYNKASNAVYTRFKSYECDDKLTEIKNSKNSGKDSIEVINDLYKLYDDFSEYNGLMDFDFDFDDDTLDIGSTACKAVTCDNGNNGDNYSCTGGSIMARANSKSVNSRVCYANKSNSNIGGYYLADLDANIGSADLSLHCEKIYDSDDNVRNQINDLIINSSIINKIIPSFSIDNLDILQSNTQEITINPSIKCNNVSTICYATWDYNSNDDFVKYYYPKIFSGKGIDGIMRNIDSDDDYTVNYGSGLPIPSDTFSGEYIKTLITNIDGEKIGENNCPYKVINNLIEEKNKNYRFNFRVIDTLNPFPGINGKNGSSRNTGSNWCETLNIGKKTSNGYKIGDINHDSIVDNEDLNGSFDVDNLEADINQDGRVVYDKDCNDKIADNCLLKGYLDKDIKFCSGNSDNYIVKDYILDKPNSNSNEPLYSFVLSTTEINAIRDYNSKNSYIDFNLECEENNTKCLSAFFTDFLNGQLNENSIQGQKENGSSCFNNRLNGEWCGNLR